MNSITRFLITLFAFFIYSNIYSQEIIVTNSKNGEPIEGVFIYEETKRINSITDENGKSDLSSFPKDAIITFTHPSFQVAKIQIQELALLKFEFTLNEKVIEFDEIVISSNKWEQNISEIPQKITRISSDQISFNNPQTSADLLSQSGEVFVQKSQLGGGSPMIRGFAANSILLVVDGIRLNNAIYRSGNLQNIINIDPNSIDATEVVYGPSSVIYGSDAMGGVMSFRTISPNLNNDQMQGGAFTRYSSASNEKTAHVNLKLSNKNIGYSGSFTYSDFEHLKSGENKSEDYKGYFRRNLTAERLGIEDVLVVNKNGSVQKPSGFNTIHTLHKVKLKVNEMSNITFAYHYGATSNIPRYDVLSEVIPNTDSLRYAEWYYGPQKWSMYAVNFQSSKNTILFNNIQSTVALQDYKESRNERDFGSDLLRMRKEHVSMITTNIYFEKQFHNSSLFYGFDFAYNYVKSRSSSVDINSRERFSLSTRYPDGGSNYSSASAYANYVKRIGDKWIFSFGGRFNDIQLNAKTNNELASTLLVNDISQSNNALNGAASIIFNSSKSVKWNFTFSTGFRAPNIDDVGKVFDLGNVITVPNPNLNPEYSYNYEIGLSKQNNSFSVNTVAFYSLLTNAIVTGDFLLNGEKQYVENGTTYNIEAQINAGKAKIFGASLNAKSIIGETLAVTTSITVTKGYELESSEPLRHIPPVFGRLGVIYKKNKIQTEFFSDYNLDKNKNKIPSNEFENKPHIYTSTGTPGWITLNLKSSYDINRCLVAQIGIENLLDQHYRPYSSGISAAGRNIIITLRGKF